MNKNSIRHPEMTSPEARNALRISLIALPASILAASFYLYLALTIHAWQLYAWSVDIWVLALAVLVSRIFIRRNQITRGVWLLLAAIAATFIGAVTLIEGIGLLLGISIVALVAVIAGQTLSTESAGRATILGLVSGAIAVLLDQFLPPYRLAQPEQTRVFLPVILVIVILLFGYVTLRQFRNYSLRTKMIISFVGITLISISIVGWISNAISSARINQQVGTNLSALTSSLAHEVAVVIDEDINIFSTLALNKFMQDEVANANVNGTSSQAVLDRLDQQWRSAADHDPLITGVLENDLAIDLLEFQSSFPGFLEIFVTDKYGAIIASTGRTSDYYQADEEWWQAAWNDGKGEVYVSQVVFDESTNAYAIDVALPVLLHNSSTPIGVLRSTIDVNVFTALTSSIELGQTGRAELKFQNDQYLDPDGAGLTTLTPEEVTQLASLPDTYGQMTFEGSPSLISKALVSAPISKHNDVIEQLGWTVIVHQDISEAHQSVAATTRSISLAAIIITGAISLLAQFLAQFLVGPVSRLTVVANQVTAGDLKAKAEIEATDEIGLLANAFNAMTSQLQESIATLESRIAERTSSLVLAADVGRSVSQVRELHSMLKDATELIRSQFDLYYSQVYLTNPAQNTLILEAGTGTVGAELISRGHRLPLNTSSINGRAAVEKRSVVISDTSTSTTFRPNPLLPDTKSEMAVPLLAGEKVVGVLDLQSQKPGALNQDILPAFEALAGQLAIAIQNANLLSEAEQARAEVETQARHLVRKNWEDYLDAIHKPEETGFLFDGNMVVSLADATNIQPSAEGIAIQAPISITGEALGTLVVEMEAQGVTPQNTELVNTIARQVAQQIENLRLLENAERYRSEAEKAARRTTIEGWKQYMDSRASNGLGYLYDTKEVRPHTELQQLKASALTLPIKAREETVGELAIQGIGPEDQDALDLAHAVAERLGAHIDSLRLLEETKRGQVELNKRAQDLTAVSEISSASTKELDIQKLLETVVHLTQRKFGLYHAHVFILDEMKAELQIRACGWKAGDPHEGTHGTARIPLAQDQSLVARAGRTREPVIVNDVHNEPGWLPNPLLPDTQSEMAVPMVIGDQLLGVLDVQSDKLNAFSQEDASIHTTLASQIATALQNAHSFEQAQRQAEREAMLNTIGQKIQGATTVEAVLQIAARELGRALGAPLTVAQLGVATRKNGNEN